MKKSCLFFLSLFSISFVSAFGYYGSFSIRNLFASLNPNDVFLGVAFLLFLFFLNLAFSRFSKDKSGNPSRAAWVPALALSVGLTYGLSRASFDISTFFYGLGFTEDFLMAFFGIVLAVGMIYAIKKKKFKYFLIGLGAFFIVLGFTELIYEKGAALIIGIVLVLFGLKFWKIFKIFKIKDKIGGEGERPREPDKEQTQTKYLPKDRSIIDLKQKYLAYLYQYYNSPTYRKTRIKQVMNTIIKMARKKGYNKRTFLSNKIANRNAKAPEDLK